MVASRSYLLNPFTDAFFHFGYESAAKRLHELLVLQIAPRWRQTPEQETNR